MPNIHMQEAATNIRKAVNDVHLLQQETQTQANDQTRQMQQRITDIDVEKKQLEAQMHDDSGQAAQHALVIARLNDELKNLQKSVNDVHANAQKQVQDLDKQVYELEGLAGRLEMMA